MADAEQQPLRVRRRLEAKREIQAAALELFEQTSFAAVTMEQIAVAAGVGVATVYRHFGTKERVVLWDEYDPMLLENVARTLEADATLDSARAAIRESLQTVYKNDAQRILRRARLVANNRPLQLAVLDELAALRAGLVRVLGQRGSGMSLLEAEVASGVIVCCLQAAIHAWVRAQGRPKLGNVIDEAFGALRTMSSGDKSRQQRPSVHAQRKRAAGHANPAR